MTEQQDKPVGVVQHMHELNDEWLQKLPIGTKLYTAPPSVEALTKEVERLTADNQLMHSHFDRAEEDDNVDGCRINNLGGYDNHWMLQDRGLLASAVLHKPSGAVFESVIACVDKRDLVTLTPPDFQSSIPPEPQAGVELTDGANGWHEYHSLGPIRRYMLDCHMDGMDHFAEFVLASDHDSRVHDLEALCDPAGITAENALLRDQTRMLDAMIKRLKDEIADHEKAYELLFKENALNQRQAVKAEPIGYLMKGQPFPGNVFYPASHKPTDIDNFIPVYAEPLSAAQGVPEGMVLVAKSSLEWWKELAVINPQDLPPRIDRVLSAAPEQAESKEGKE